MRERPYSSDLTDQEWQRLEPLIPPAKRGGRKRSTDMREVLNAIFYVVKTACQWDMLPRDFPAKGTVYEYFNQWSKDGTWERMNAKLRVAVRLADGREATPSAAIVDSQSVETTEKGAFEAMTPPSKSRDANGMC
jgi:putative transposase